MVKGCFKEFGVNLNTSYHTEKISIGTVHVHTCICDSNSQHHNALYFQGDRKAWDTAPPRHEHSDQEQI